MKKLVLSLLAVAVLASVSMAFDKVPTGKVQKLNGYISDEQCGAKGIDNVDCIKRCAAEGKKLVFVSDKDHEVLKVANQEILKGHEGQHISITAKEGKDGLQVTKIEAAK